MAFGQRLSLPPRSWGDAPGYDAARPSALTDAPQPWSWGDAGDAPGYDAARPSALTVIHLGRRPYSPTPAMRSMPQSLTRLYAHLIFSTKNREAWLHNEIRPRVHAYLATTIRDLESPWVVVGGVADHVHILFDMGKMLPPVKFVEHVKRESSKFVKTLGPQYAKFYWQRGYSMFSVGPKQRDDAEHYVRNQEEHHRKTTFQDEYRKILSQYGIDFDEQYVWD